MSQEARGQPSRRYRRHLFTLPPPTAGEVYFVQAQTLRLIKIGFAVDAGSRLRSLQVGSPDVLHLLGSIYSMDAKALEETLHARFRAHHRHGEWFHPASELLAFIDAEASGDSSGDSLAELMAAALAGP